MRQQERTNHARDRAITAAILGAVQEELEIKNGPSGEERAHRKPVKPLEVRAESIEKRRAQRKRMGRRKKVSLKLLDGAIVLPPYDDRIYERERLQLAWDISDRLPEEERAIVRGELEDVDEGTIMLALGDMMVPRVTNRLFRRLQRKAHDDLRALLLQALCKKPD